MTNSLHISRVPIWESYISLASGQRGNRRETKGEGEEVGRKVRKREEEGEVDGGRVRTRSERKREKE